MKAGLFLIFTTITLASCATYHIPKASLISQFKGIDSTDLVTKKVVGPLREYYEYLANPIVAIHCLDKNGNEQTLANSPSIEMRVTEKGGRKTILYFDRILLTDSTLVGVRSRFAPSIDKAIRLESINKVEMQDGRKDFEYAN